MGAGSIISNNSSTIARDGDGNNCIRVCLSSDQIPLEVVVSPILPTDFDPLNEYAEISAVAVSTESTVVSYTVPVGKVAVVSNVEVSGDNIATYRVKLNGTTIAKRRTYVGGSPNEWFPFDRYQIAAGDVIIVTAENCSLTSMTSDFEARINGAVGDV